MPTDCIVKTLSSRDGVEGDGTTEVLKIWEGSAIQLNVSPDNYSYVVDSSFYAESKLVAVWSRNGHIVPHLDNYYEYGISSEGVTMRVPFPLADDSGLWVVEIYDRNKLHRGSKDFQSPYTRACFIYVIPRMSDMVEREEIVALLGSNLRLEIDTAEASRPEVQWSLPNKKVELTGGNRLELVNLDYSDSGKYTATFERDDGTVGQKYFIVDVQGPPEALRGLSVRDKREKVEISWNGCTFDGGAPVEYYTVYFDDNELNTTRLSINIDKSKCKCENHCVFQVAAVNKHGVGKLSSVEFCDKVELQCEGFESYKKFEELGKGRFGTVFRVEKGGQSYAGKFIKCIRAADKDKARQEVEILSLLKGHEKLVHIVAAYQIPREIVIITELLNGGELFERIVADDFNLTENKCREFMRDILLGVKFVHEKSIIHLDIKPENILITPAGLKIIDFGLSQKFDPNVKQCVMFGTPEFVSPEIINYEPIGFYCDIWSIGVLAYVLVSGLSPFMGDNDSETLANVTRGEFDFDDEAFDKVSQECLTFIRGCLALPHTNRLSADECLDHSWMQQNSDAEIKKDKLKGFVLRRKWQKTGNAIRAIGRLRSICSTSSSEEKP